MNTQLKSILIAGAVGVAMMSSMAVHAKDVNLTAAKGKQPVSYSFVTMLRTITTSEITSYHQSAHTDIKTQLIQSKEFQNMESCNKERQVLKELLGANIQIKSTTDGRPSNNPAISKTNEAATFGECTPNM